MYLSSELTIKGTSSDINNTNCTIATSINNIQPFQTASAIGLQGEQDYSNWSSTFNNVTNLLRLGKNTITSLIICLDTDNNTPTSSSHLINVTGQPSENNQSILSSVSKVIHDDLENKLDERNESSDHTLSDLQSDKSARPTDRSHDQQTSDLQSDKSARPTDRSHDQSKSQHQSTLSPNSGQSTTGNH